MPIKTGGTGERRVEMEVVVPGTPEQVWQAMATGPGNAAWFTKATIDERVGGQIRFDVGAAGGSSGEVTAWEPPHRFAFVERDWSEGAPPVATEITITSRSGDRCVMRMVHSLFSASDEWDDQLEGFESGWPWFFEVLRVYLSRFAGWRAASFQVMASVDDDPLAIWMRLVGPLDLAGANAGERRATPAGPDQLSGVIERVRQDDTLRVILMRLEAPAPGVALLGTYRAGTSVNASITVYFYGDDVDRIAAASEHTWGTWLRETFPALPSDSATR
jgi:uncharacterized protein YndB with AHSA1/START domain